MATTPAGALREFEQAFLSQRTQAANTESWEAYRKDTLPAPRPHYPDDERVLSLINQGFDAGFDAAMNRVRMLLYTMQANANAVARGHDDLSQAEALATNEKE